MSPQFPPLQNDEAEITVTYSILPPLSLISYLAYLASNITQTGIAMSRRTGSKHPPPIAARPTFRSIPERVVGIPVIRAILFRALDMPKALFHEKENPYFRPIVPPHYITAT